MENRPRIFGSVMALFRAAKTIIGHDEDEQPEPKRRRRGETESEFALLARKLSRWFRDMRRDFRENAGEIASGYIALGAEAYAAAAEYVQDRFNAFNQPNNDEVGTDLNEHYDTNQNHPSFDL